MTGAPPRVIVGVDGGGSKTDAVAVTVDGDVVGRAQGAGSSPDFEGLARSVEAVNDVIRSAAGDHPIDLVHLYLSGVDLPVELVNYRTAIVAYPWAAVTTVIENDLYALLRAGTDEADAVAVVCGTGINAVGVRADGATVRFPSLGLISGDWGGGSGLGEQALWHAARDVDGRGPNTALTEEVVAGMGADSIPALIEDLHFGRRSLPELAGLAPAVFRVAEQGDPVAIGLVERQVDEIVAFATASLRRLELLDSKVPVVLGGGIIRAGHRDFIDRIASQLAAVAPLARLQIVTAPPILGAVLLALEAANATPDAVGRATRGLAASAPRS